MLMDFLARPFLQNLASDGGLVLAERGRLRIEHDVNGLGDAEAEIFQGSAHGWALPGGIAPNLNGKLNGFVLFRKLNPAFPECARNVMLVPFVSRLWCATLNASRQHAAVGHDESSETMGASCNGEREARR